MSDVSPERKKRMISRFWTWFFRSQTLQFSLLFLLVLAFGAFVGVLFCECIEMYISKLLGLSFQKNETLKFLGISMGGILIALQALMSYRRAKAMEETAEAQADAAKAQADAVSKTEQGQRQERLKNAIEHLGHESDSVRLGGAYELFHLAKDTLKEDAKEKLSQTVLDILCAHIRQTTGESKYRETHKSKPSEEVQSLLTLLFVQKHEVFKGCHINLQGSWLNGADLREARLEKAVLTETNLQGADLAGADLQRANLIEARLQRANLSTTNLQGALLRQAQLQGAYLSWAQLQGALLRQAQLQGATLNTAQLQGATLDTAQLQGAYLIEARLQGTDLLRTDLRGAQSQIRVSPKFSQRMRELIGQESDLSGSIFEGGLSQKDLDSLVEGFSDKKAKELREKLEPHIDKPVSHQLPEDSGARTDSYTEQEAEQWIAEYEQAMSEVPEDDS